MIESYVTKILFVDERFLEDLAQVSRTRRDEFCNPSLDTKVISLPLDSPSEIENLSHAVDISSIHPGSIVVKQSFTDQFVPLDDFSEDLVLRKYGLFVQLCVALGAKRVFISSLDNVSLESSSNARYQAELAVSAPLGKSEADLSSVKSEMSDDLGKLNMKFNVHARGGEPDIAAAERLMNQYGLHKDSLFTDLFNMCRVSTNKLSRHQLDLDFSKDVKRVLDSSLQTKIDLMSTFYAGKAEFERTKNSLERSRTATKLSIVVEF